MIDFCLYVMSCSKGGCIVFTHRTGGQIEIIGNEERLKYSSDAEAVRKIEVENFPAFIIVDDKGNDFFADL